MRKYAFYLGCATPVKALKYEISAWNLARHLGIELVDVPEFGCCGYPVKSMDASAALLMAARNLAAAEERGLDIIGLCTGCMAILAEARESLEDAGLRGRINEQLKAIGAGEYSGRVSIKHFARVFYEDFGLEAVREKIVNPLRSLKFAVHYGCHYAKPTHAHGCFDDPSRPATIDRLMQIAGAETLDYPNKNRCCGMTVLGPFEDIGVKLASEKLEILSERGADAMIVACPSCCIAYENNQKFIGRKTDKEFNLPVLYFTQVLGLAMGLTENELGFEFNRIKFPAA